MAIRRLPLTCSKGWQTYASHGSMRAAIYEELTVRSSDYTKARLADDGLDELRFSGLLTPKRAEQNAASPNCTTPARASSPPGNGIHRHPREYGPRAHP
ncbi:hypothetical protein ACVXHB_02535 [Escherichia coli]